MNDTIKHHKNTNAQLNDKCTKLQIEIENIVKDFQSLLVAMEKQTKRIMETFNKKEIILRQRINELEGNDEILKRDNGQLVSLCDYLNETVAALSENKIEDCEILGEGNVNLRGVKNCLPTKKTLYPY